jgi:hypothetical protein
MNLINLLNSHLSQVLLLAYLLYIIYTLYYTKTFSVKTALMVTVVFILTVRFFDFEYWWSNPDLGQWIICAKSMVENPKEWILNFSLFDFTRMLTVLPLSVLFLIKGSVTYFDAHIIFLISIIGFIFIQLIILKKLFQKDTVIIVLALFTVYFTMSNHCDYRLYNSEVPVILLYSVTTLFFVKALETNKGWFFIGFLLSLMPFAKEQSAVIAIVSFLYVLVYHIIRKSYKDCIRLVFGACLGGGLIFFMILMIHGLDNVLWIFSIGLDYKEVGVVGKTVDESHKLLVFLHFRWINKEMLLILPLAVLGLILSVIKLSKNQRGNDATIIGYYAIGFLVAIYSVYTPGNGSMHYNFLLWPGLLFFMSFLIRHLQQIRPRSIHVIFGLVFLIMINDIRVENTRPWRAFESYKKKTDEWREDPFILSLIENKISKKDVVLWGWDTVTPVLFGFNRTTGFLYPQFAYGEYKNVKQVRDNYLKTVQTDRPEYFIELVGAGRRYFKDINKYSVSKSFEDLQKELDKHYELISSGNNFKIYKRVSV